MYTFPLLLASSKIITGTRLDFPHPAQNHYNNKYERFVAVQGRRTCFSVDYGHSIHLNLAQYGVSVGVNRKRLTSGTVGGGLGTCRGSTGRGATRLLLQLRVRVDLTEHFIREAEITKLRKKYDGVEVLSWLFGICQHIRKFVSHQKFVIACTIEGVGGCVPPVRTPESCLQ
jgi:hypothetical protein